jgi:hypothetical protein
MSDCLEELLEGRIEELAVERPQGCDKHPRPGRAIQALEGDTGLVMPIHDGARGAGAYIGAHGREGRINPRSSRQMISHALTGS